MVVSNGLAEADDCGLAASPITPAAAAASMRRRLMFLPFVIALLLLVKRWAGRSLWRPACCPSSVAHVLSAYRDPSSRGEWHGEALGVEFSLRSRRRGK